MLNLIVPGGYGQLDSVPKRSQENLLASGYNNSYRKPTQVVEEES